MGIKKKKKKSKSGSSNSSQSTISTDSMLDTIERLRVWRHKGSTRENYYAIWKNFNQFYIRLDRKPGKWEDRILLYVAFLIESNKKSTTIRSYVSALKAILTVNKIEINEDRFLLSSLTRACKMKNDSVKTKLPIHKSLLNLILKMINDEIKLKDNQPDLAVLYQALFATGYYGLFRIGELTRSEHIIKAKDVHIGINKNKILFVLHSSKTHTKADKPQIVKIKGKPTKVLDYCPFSLLRKYLAIHRSRQNELEQFFIFKDRSLVLPAHARVMLHRCLKKLNLDITFYSLHGLRSGHVSDMLRAGILVETIKKIGWWRSNAVYTYLRNISEAK